MREWVGRFAVAADRGTSEHLMLLEDDVLSRGPIDHAGDFAMAGPWHRRATLSPTTLNFLRQCGISPASTHFGGCGGTLFHRETFLQCARSFNYAEFAALPKFDRGWEHSDIFITLMMLLGGHSYTSLEEVYCEEHRISIPTGRRTASRLFIA